MAPPHLDITSHHFARTPAGLSLDSQVFEDARRALANLETQQRQFARHALATEERQSRTAEVHAQQRRELEDMRQDISRELATLRTERQSASQAKAKLERILLEVLKGKKDLQAGTAPSALVAQKRAEE